MSGGGLEHLVRAADAEDQRVPASSELPGRHGMGARLVSSASSSTSDPEEEEEEEDTIPARTTADEAADRSQSPNGMQAPPAAAYQQQQQQKQQQQQQHLHAHPHSHHAYHGYHQHSHPDYAFNHPHHHHHPHQQHSHHYHHAAPPPPHYPPPPPHAHHHHHHHHHPHHAHPQQHAAYPPHPHTTSSNTYGAPPAVVVQDEAALPTPPPPPPNTASTAPTPATTVAPPEVLPVAPSPPPLLVDAAAVAVTPPSTAANSLEVARQAMDDFMKSMGMEERSSTELLPPPKGNIDQMLDNDVLSGRGGKSNHHHGNLFYRNLVKACQPAYIAAKRRDKPKIAECIVGTVRHLGGRFLKSAPSSASSAAATTSDVPQWVDVGNTKAREKTSQALREGAPEMRGDRETPSPPPSASQQQQPSKKRRVSATAVQPLYPSFAPEPNRGTPPRNMLDDLAAIATAARSPPSTVSPEQEHRRAIQQVPSAAVPMPAAAEPIRGPRIKLLKHRFKREQSSISSRSAASSS